MELVNTPSNVITDGYRERIVCKGYIQKHGIIDYDAIFFVIDTRHRESF